MALTLGEAATVALDQMRMGAGRVPAARPRLHRTGAAIRRDSIEAGTFEDRFFAVPAKGETDRLLRMARVALDQGRRLKRAVRAEGLTLSPTEAAMTAMTASAVRVFEELCTLARLNAGRVFPSYDRLAEATALGRATVARALTILERAGFLVRQRRFKRVEGEGEGPRYAQTSNAYRPIASARLMPHLPRWIAPSPIPDDAAHREAERVRAVVGMQASLSCRELAKTSVGGALGCVLAKLGAALDRHWCESQNQPQPLPDSIYFMQNGLSLAGRRISTDDSER